VVDEPKIEFGAGAELQCGERREVAVVGAPFGTGR
jgi:hypothetical protein